MTGKASANLPAMPDIHPNAAEVGFAMFQCRTCGEQSPWVRQDEQGRHHVWDHDHFNRTRHNKFYMYSLVRTNARVGRF